eukprot:SAG11_NODE_1903_length_4090_cov_9.110805_2_plen_47_part_00
MGVFAVDTPAPLAGPSGVSASSSASTEPCGEGVAATTQGADGRGEA